jgi:hypothetical protein
MPKRLHLRDVSPEEATQVCQLATSRRAAARLVQRAGNKLPCWIGPSCQRQRQVARPDTATMRRGACGCGASMPRA